MIQKNKIDPEFGKQVSDWICASSFQHILLCFHEGTHLLYARECGYEPEVYGPTEKLIGSVDSPTHEVFMTADILSLAKLRLGPAYIEERIFGEDRWKEVWAVARYDSENYHNWRRNYWRRIDRDVSPAAIRKAVYADFERAEFRERLMAAAREYERRVFGESVWEKSN